MSADFICVWIPLCNITEERKQEINNLIEFLTGEDPAGIHPTLEDWKLALKDAVLTIDPESPEVNHLTLPGALYPVLITGGMSYGDSPTDAFDSFVEIGNCKELFALLEHFAIKDLSN